MLSLLIVLNSFVFGADAGARDWSTCADILSHVVRGSNYWFAEGKLPDWIPVNSDAAFDETDGWLANETRELWKTTPLREIAVWVALDRGGQVVARALEVGAPFDARGPRVDLWNPFVDMYDQVERRGGFARVAVVRSIHSHILDGALITPEIAARGRFSNIDHRMALQFGALLPAMGLGHVSFRFAILEPRRRTEDFAKYEYELPKTPHWSRLAYPLPRSKKDVLRKISRGLVEPFTLLRTD